MLFANDREKIRIHADDAKKTERYFCPTCGQELIIKQGEINAWHFAHKAGGCSDNWHYDMSSWHIFMQNLFPHECQEIVVSDHGITHRADVLKDNIVIEFQHSSLKKSEFDDRNNFFLGLGYRVVWVFDLRDAYQAKRLQWISADEKLKIQKYYQHEIFGVSIRPKIPGCNGQPYIWQNPLRMLCSTPILSAHSDKFALWFCLQDKRKMDFHHPMDFYTDKEDTYGMIRINNAYGAKGRYNFSGIWANDELLWTTSIHEPKDFFCVWESKEPIGIKAPIQQKEKPTPYKEPGIKWEEHQIKMQKKPADSKPKTAWDRLFEHPTYGISQSVTESQKQMSASELALKQQIEQTKAKETGNQKAIWKPDILVTRTISEIEFSFFKMKFWAYTVQEKRCEITSGDPLSYQCPKSNMFMRSSNFSCNACSHCAALGIQKEGGVKILCIYPKSLSEPIEIVEIVSQKGVGN